MRKRSTIKRAADAVTEAVFPSNIYCIRCGSLIDATRPYSLCDECVRTLRWINGRTCAKCGKALPDTYRGERCYDCMRTEHAFSKGYSCLAYGLHERELLMDYKYGGKGYLGRKLGDILYDRISCENIDVDVIVPVPVHASREKERGYDQAELMAERLAALWGKPLETRALSRRKNTVRLRSLSPAERELELEDAFTVREWLRENIRDKKILLIDDIYTTGATADACSRALFAGGASEVFLLTLAAGGNRRPPREEM